MEKFIALPESSGAGMDHCNKDACTSCRNKQEILQQAVADQADDDSVNILRLYYAALLQGYSFEFRIGNQDTSFFQSQ